MFAFSVGSMVLATVDVGRQGIAGGSGQIKIGASRGVAESSCGFVFNQNCTDGVECLFFDRSVLEDVHNIGELLRKVAKLRMIRYCSVTSSRVPSSS